MGHGRFSDEAMLQQHRMMIACIRLPMRACQKNIARLEPSLNERARMSSDALLWCWWHQARSNARGIDSDCLLRRTRPGRSMIRRCVADKSQAPNGRCESRALVTPASCAWARASQATYQRERDQHKLRTPDGARALWTLQQNEKRMKERFFRARGRCLYALIR